MLSRIISTRDGFVAVRGRCFTVELGGRKSFGVIADLHRLTIGLRFISSLIHLFASVSFVKKFPTFKKKVLYVKNSKLGKIYNLPRNVDGK